MEVRVFQRVFMINQQQRDELINEIKGQKPTYWTGISTLFSEALYLMTDEQLIELNERIKRLKLPKF
jgi:hypothetical protein